MPPKDKNKLNINEIRELFSTNLRRAVNRPSINGYIPHDKQIEFHSAPDKGRLYVGGNRAGKTVGGCVEDIWWLTNKHPYRETPPPPVRGRLVCVDFKQGFEQIIKPEILKWIPMSSLINGSWEDSFDNRLRVLTLENGSFLEFMSYEQDIEKFAGTSRHFVHYDEEPPEGIFTECSMRLIDTAGSWWITMTPLNGMGTFIYKDIFKVGQVPGNGIKVIVVDINDNPYISPLEIQNVLNLIKDPEERKARERGEFVQIGGLAFKSFRSDIHVIDPIIPPLEWKLYASMDHGFNNPTAWHFHSIRPDGTVITWDEIYDNELTVPEWADILKAKNSETGRRTPDVYVGDPSIRQRSAHRGTSIQQEYAARGIPIVLANNDQLLGVNKINNYLKSAKWFVTENNSFLIDQLQTVRWQTWTNRKAKDTNNPKEKLQEHNNHATDGARYLFSILPEIQAVDLGPKLKEKARIVAESILSPTAGIPSGGYSIDRIINQGMPKKSSEWTVVDEHMGGYF